MNGEKVYFSVVLVVVALLLQACAVKPLQVSLPFDLEIKTDESSSFLKHQIVKSIGESLGDDYHSSETDLPAVQADTDQSTARDLSLQGHRNKEYNKQCFLYLQNYRVHKTLQARSVDIREEIYRIKAQVMVEFSCGEDTVQTKLFVSDSVYEHLVRVDLIDGTYSHILAEELVDKVLSFIQAADLRWR